MADDFQKFWAVASKLVPFPHGSSSSSGRSGASSPVLTTTSTLDSSNASRMPDTTAMRSVPMRIYLPHGGPVVQDVVSTLLPSREPQTLQTALTSLLPLLFPAGPPPGEANMSISFMAPVATSSSGHKQLAKRVVVQGIEMPLDAELGWLSSCLAGPDGWLGVVLGL